MRVWVLFILLLAAITANAQVDQSIALIKCDADTSQSYSVYLPSGYSKTQKTPVIFLFDAAARGRYAVSLFKSAADEMGYAVIGSNNSKNGPMNLSLQATNNMFADAFKKYNLDEGRVYLGGFSGGARVATTIALQSPGIAGVIACSAAFSEPILAGKLPWFFIGTAGSRDFNYVEMQQVHKTLNAQQSTNSLITFNGPHSWPPKDVIREALFLANVYRRKAQLTASDTVLVKYRQFILTQISSAISLSAKGEMYERLLTVDDDAETRQQYEALKKQPQYQTGVSLHDQLYTKELNFETDAANALQFIVYRQTERTQPQSWWRGKQSEFKKQLVTGNKADSDYVARQRLFLSANISESFENCYRGGLYDQADELLQIAIVFDTTDPMIAYRYARLCAARNDDEGALNYLEEAVKKGFKNNAMINNEKAFYFIRNNKRFIALVN